MIGDKLVITEYHRDNGKKVAEAVLKKLKETSEPLAVTVAGESGSGKSETAATTAEILESNGVKTLILGQDDYFQLPPKSNAAKRKVDISWVGMTEVRLDIMGEHLRAIKESKTQITKPLIYFEEDRIGKETLDLTGVRVVIAEGTYTTSLDADVKAFIDATYHHTLEHRKKRARDATEGAFIEKVLEIEHQIISAHKSLAHVILPPNPEQ